MSPWSSNYREEKEVFFDAAMMALDSRFEHHLKESVSIGFFKREHPVFSLIRIKKGPGHGSFMKAPGSEIAIAYTKEFSQAHDLTTDVGVLKVIGHDFSGIQVKGVFVDPYNGDAQVFYSPKGLQYKPLFGYSRNRITVVTNALEDVFRVALEEKDKLLSDTVLNSTESQY